MKRSHDQHDNVSPVENPFDIDELRRLLLSLAVTRCVFHTYAALLCVSHRFYATTSSLIATHFDRPAPTDGGGLSDYSLLLTKKELAYHYKGAALALRKYTTPHDTIDNDVLTRLTQLTALDLTSNDRITSRTLVRMTGLRHLNLDNNPIINMWALHHLTNLTTLSLFNNSRIGSNGLLHHLSSITSLVLKDSQHITNEELVQMAPRLRRLTLCQDGGWVLSETVGRLTALEALNLENNGIVRGDALATLTALRTLNLRNNEVVDDCWLARLTQLTELDLASNDKITDAGLGPLVNLRVLSLNNNLVVNDTPSSSSSGITANSLQQLASLRDLSLANTHGEWDLANQDYRQFKAAHLVSRCLTALERLDLSDNETDIELQHLTHLDRMRLAYDGYDETMLRQVKQFVDEWNSSTLTSSSSPYKAVVHDELNRILEWQR